MRYLLPLTILAAIGVAAFFLLAPNGPRWERLATPEPMPALPSTPQAQPLAPPPASEPVQPAMHRFGGAWHHHGHVYRRYEERDWRPHPARDQGFMGPVDVEPPPPPPPPAETQTMWVDGYGRAHPDFAVKQPGSEMDSKSRRAPYHGYRDTDD